MNVMPSENQPAKRFPRKQTAARGAFRLLVVCESQQRRLYEQLTAAGVPVRVLTMPPDTTKT
jgi:hypothetical protein